jgi:hypothetical protein
LPFVLFILFLICRFRCSIICVGYPLFLAIWYISFSFCCYSCVSGNWYNLLKRNLYAASLCCVGWLDLQCIVVSFNKVISDKLIFVHLLVNDNQLYKDAWWIQCEVHSVQVYLLLLYTT